MKMVDSYLHQIFYDCPIAGQTYYFSFNRSLISESNSIALGVETVVSFSAFLRNLFAASFTNGHLLGKICVSDISSLFYPIFHA